MGVPITLLAGLFQLLMIGPYLENLYHQASQCGNLANYSITQILREINFWTPRRFKNDIFAIFGDWIFVFGQFQPAECAKIPKKSKFRSCVKLAIHEALGLQPWIHVKSEWQKNSQIFTLWNPYFSGTLDRRVMQQTFGNIIGWNWKWF